MAASPRPTDSMAETAYRTLRSAILTNLLPPGYFASERELGERFELSRTPVREALLRLRDEGLIEALPRRGVRVLPLSTDEMRAIHEVNRALELEAALTAATRADLADIEAAVIDMERATEVEDRKAWVEADKRFHMHLVAASRNPRLIQIYNGLRDLTDRARFFTLAIRPFPARSTEDHRQMFEAIRAGDEVAIMRVTRRHWDRTTTEMVELIETFNSQRAVAPSADARRDP
jgi:DNA-binding GntR family transcriptional regulator